MNGATQISLPWGRMSVDIRGAEGIPWVFLPGTGCDNADWDGVLGAMEPNARVVMMEFRGHGTSDPGQEALTFLGLVDDVVGAVSRLGIERYLLAGHSLGGMAGIELARQDKRLAGLVLLEGWTSAAAFGAFGSDRYYGELESEAIRRIQEKSAATKGRFSDAVWLAFQKSLRDWDGFDVLKSTDVPVWEVYGTKGKTEQTEAELHVPARPNIRWVWLDGAGHYLPHERPGDVARVCSEAMRQVGG